jgi:tetratricopeptide (TPR) repeat protein
VLFLALEARGPRLAELATRLQPDPGALFALGLALLLDRSDPAAAAFVLGPVAWQEHPWADLVGRAYEFALLQAESYVELVDLLTRRPPRGFAPPAVRRAEALWRAGYPEARQAFGQLVEETFDAYARARLEEVLEAEGDYRTLAELYGLALEKTPSVQDRSLLLLRLGEILESHLGDPEGAARLYAQAEGGSLSAAITSRRRALHRKARDWEAYADCLREEARHVEDRRRAAALDLIAGRTLLEAVGDPLEAARAFREALRLHPEDPRSREFLGESLLLAGDQEGLAELHEGPLAALLRRDATGLGELPAALQAVAAARSGDRVSLAAACRRWADQEELSDQRAALLTLAAQTDPDPTRARQDANAALFVVPDFLPALLTLARLSVLEGRMRAAMELLGRAAELAGNGQIRVILLLEAAEVGAGLGDPGAIAQLQRGAAQTLFGQGSLPLEPAALAELLGEGGVWARHTIALLREARRAGHRQALPLVALALARRGQDEIAREALRIAAELFPGGSPLRSGLLEVLAGHQGWAEAIRLLEGTVRPGSESRPGWERLSRISLGDLATPLPTTGPRGTPDQRRTTTGGRPRSPVPGREAAALDTAEGLLRQAERTSDWDEAIQLLLQAGERFRRQGDWARAEEAFQQVLARNVTEPRALAALADLSREHGDWAGTREWLARLSEVESEREARLDILLLRARIALEQEGDRAAAAKDYEACLVIDPGCPEAYSYLEHYYREVKDYETLRILYLQGSEQGGARGSAPEGTARRLELLVALAELEAGPLGHPERAIAHLKRALSLKPGDVGLLRQLADAAGQAALWRERVEALETLARQVKDAGERAALYLEIAGLYRDRLGGGGVVLENTMVAFVCDNTNRRAFDELEGLLLAERRWREIIGIYDVALGAARNGAAYEVGDLLRRKGLVLARHLDAPQEATEALLAALEQSPDDEPVREALELLLTQTHDVAQRLRMLEILAEAREGRSRAELLLHAAALAATLPGREQTSERYYQRALHLSAEADERSAAALEGIYRRAGRWEELATLFGELAAHAPEANQRRHLLLQQAAVVERELRDTARAIAIYQQLLERDEADPEALHALARLYEASRGWDQLLAVSRRELAHASRPEDRGLLLFRIGSILETQRRDEQGAEDAYRAALGEDRRCFPALHGLRDLYLRRQDWRRAVETLEFEAALWEEPRDRAAILVHTGNLLHQRLGDRPRAIAAYRRALRTCPGFPAAVSALLPLLIDAGAWEEAGPLARLLTRAVAGNAKADATTRRQALTWRAQVALHLEELAEACGALVLALGIEPTHPESLAIARQCALSPAACRAPADSLEELLTTIEATGPAAEAAALWLPTLRGRVAEARHDVDEALRHYRIAARALPSAAEASRPLVDLLVRLRRFREAGEALQLLADHGRHPRERAQARLRQAELLLDRQGEPAAARALLERSLQELDLLRRQDSDESWGTGEEAVWRQVLFLGAQLAFLETRWDDGYSLLQRLIEAEEQDPRDVHGPESLGRYLYYRGRLLRDGLQRPEEAAASFYQAVQEAPGLADPVIALARLLWEEGDEEELAELLEGQLPLAERRGGAEEKLRLLYFRAQSLLAAGRDEEGLELLRRAIDEVDRPGLARRLLADLLQQTGQPTAAIAELRAALRVDPEPEAVLGELATAWEEQGDLRRSELARAARLGLLEGYPAAAAEAAAPDQPAVVEPPPQLPAQPLARAHLDRLLRPLDTPDHLWALWAELAALLGPPRESPPHHPRPLEVTPPELQTLTARLADFLELAPPELRLADELPEPSALAGDVLLLDAGLLGQPMPGATTFWLAGPLYLQSRGLGIALAADREVAHQAARICAGVLAEASGVAVPSWLTPGEAPPAALELARQRLATPPGTRPRFSDNLLEPERFLASVRRTAHRFGLLATGEPTRAIRALRLATSVADASGPEKQRDLLDLLDYAVSEAHLQARDALDGAGG